MKILNKYISSKRGGVVIEFALLIPFYLVFIFMILDMIFIFIQWADIQRANGMMSELIKNRIPSVVDSGIAGTWTTQDTYVTKYCSLLFIKGLCQKITIIIAHSETPNTRTMPDYSRGYFCYSTVGKCDTLAIYSNPFQNNNQTISITTWAETYKIINVKIIPDYFFSLTAEATNVVSLND